LSSDEKVGIGDSSYNEQAGCCAAPDGSTSPPWPRNGCSHRKQTADFERLMSVLEKGRGGVAGNVYSDEAAFEGSMRRT